MVRTIEITGIDSSVSPHTLTLSDGGDTVANPGDTIQWTIGPNSGVAAITRIQDNSDINVFHPDPAFAEGVWSGVINPDFINGHYEELYTILYTTANDDTKRSYDPKIQVDS